MSQDKSTLAKQIPEIFFRNWN